MSDLETPRDKNERTITDANYAKTVFSLYCEYGLGEFDNWLLMKKGKILRREVVEALGFPLTRQAAERQLAFHEYKAKEIESMIDESQEKS